jgi:hypothetical protein
MFFSTSMVGPIHASQHVSINSERHYTDIGTSIARRTGSPFNGRKHLRHESDETKPARSLNKSRILSAHAYGIDNIRCSDLQALAGEELIFLYVLTSCLGQHLWRPGDARS